MKIQQLLSGLPIVLSNEEHDFVKKYKDKVKITSLDEHDLFLAQNLVRRGVFEISNDNVTIVNNSQSKDS